MIPDRLVIRAIVTRQSDEMRAHLLAGGNPYQKMSEQNDIIRAMIADYADEEKIEFNRVFTEEVKALTLATEDRIRRLRAQTESIQEETTRTIAQTHARSNEPKVMWGAISVVSILLYLIWLLSR